MEAPVYKEALTIHDKITGDKFVIIEVAPEMFKFKRFVYINGEIYLDKKILSETEIKMIKRYIKNIKHTSDYVELIEHTALQIKFKPQPSNINKKVLRKKVANIVASTFVAIAISVSAVALSAPGDNSKASVQTEYTQVIDIKTESNEEPIPVEKNIVPLAVKEEKVEIEQTPIIIEEAADVSSQPHLDRFLDSYPGISKSYESFRAITNTDSKQYKLLRNIAEKENGYLKVDDFYCVALGPKFGEIGEKYIFTLENGKQIKCIKGDEKAEKDTIDGFVHSTDSSVIEFIIDPSAPEMVKVTTLAADGKEYVYGGNFNNNPEFCGSIVAIEKVEDYEIANSLFYGKSR